MGEVPNKKKKSNVGLFLESVRIKEQECQSGPVVHQRLEKKKIKDLGKKVGRNNGRYKGE